MVSNSEWAAGKRETLTTETPPAADQKHHRNQSFPMKVHGDFITTMIRRMTFAEAIEVVTGLSPQDFEAIVAGTKMIQGDSVHGFFIVDC